MLKKIISAVLLIGFIGVLVWGGINRTLAKTNSTTGRNANNQNSEYIEYTTGNGTQQRSNDGQGNNARTEAEAASAEQTIAQDAALSQAESEATDLQSVSAEENTAALTEGTGTGRGTQGENRSQGNGGQGRGSGNSQGNGSNPLDAAEIEALNLALDDEYHALAVYQSVIATFGEVEPFVEIAASEQRHIGALINQFNKHGLEVPANPWIGNIPAFESVQQACQTGVQAEIDNAALYDRLFTMTDDASLIRVFTNLSNASLNSHLPDFQACQ